MWIPRTSLSSCLQHWTWGLGPSPRAEDESSVCFLWGGQHASPKKGEPQHEVVSAEATAEERVDEVARESPEPTLCHLQHKMNALFPPMTPSENCLPMHIGDFHLKIWIISSKNERYWWEPPRNNLYSSRGLRFVGSLTRRDKLIFPYQGHNWSSCLCTWPLIRN